MTTGTILSDGRYDMSNPWSTFKVGPYYRKTWNGGDRVEGEGKDVPHAYSMELLNRIHGSHAYMGYRWNLPTPDGAPFTWDANEEIALLGKLADEYNQHDWNAGVFVGELGKTTDTLASRVRQFGRAALQAKRGKFKASFRTLRTNPRRGHVSRLTTVRKADYSKWFELWLEMRYAWRPLLFDIYNLSEAIAKRDTPRSVRIKVSVKKPTALVIPLGNFFLGDGYSYGVKAIIANLQEVQPSIPDYLGLTNPMAVVWELVPLSFVVDWFIPIGDYIRTRNAISRMQGTYVRTTLTKCWVRFTGQTTPAGQAAGYSDPNGFSQTIRVTRTLHTSLSVPLPVFKNPLATNSPGKRLLDAVALVAAAFTFRKEPRSLLFL